VKKFSSDKDINNEVKTLVKTGWAYFRKKKHGLIIAPNGHRVIVPGTPSDRRSLYNFRRDIRHLDGGTYVA